MLSQLGGQFKENSFWTAWENTTMITTAFSRVDYLTRELVIVQLAARSAKYFVLPIFEAYVVPCDIVFTYTVACDRFVLFYLLFQVPWNITPKIWSFCMIGFD
jgi:hypothetical protein